MNTTIAVVTTLVVLLVQIELAVRHND